MTLQNLTVAPVVLSAAVGSALLAKMATSAGEGKSTQATATLIAFGATLNDDVASATATTTSATTTATAEADQATAARTAQRAGLMTFLDGLAIPTSQLAIKQRAQALGSVLQPDVSAPLPLPYGFKASRLTRAGQLSHSPSRAPRARQPACSPDCPTVCSPDRLPTPIHTLSRSHPHTHTLATHAAHANHEADRACPACLLRRPRLTARTRAPVWSPRSSPPPPPASPTTRLRARCSAQSTL